MSVLRRKHAPFAVALAVGAFVLQWLDYQYAVRLFSTEIYILILAAIFTGFGIWVGVHITRVEEPKLFKKNVEAIKYLRMTNRECDVLEHLARGFTNKEMAIHLHVSTSTIKTHLIHVYQKLDVSRRTEAIHKARSLRIIP